MTITTQKNKEIDAKLSSKELAKMRATQSSGSQVINFKSLEHDSQHMNSQTRNQQARYDDVNMTFALNTAVNSSKQTSVRGSDGAPGGKQILEKELAHLQSLHNLRNTDQPRHALFPPIG